MNKPFNSPGSVSVTFPAMVLPPTSSGRAAIETVARTAPGYATPGTVVRLAGGKAGSKQVQRNRMAQAVGQAAKSFAASQANTNPLAEHARKGGCK